LKKSLSKKLLFAALRKIAQETFSKIYAKTSRIYKKLIVSCGIFPYN